MRTVIGEGFGYLVDACGTALLDYALPANGTQAYSAPFRAIRRGRSGECPVEHRRAAPLSLTWRRLRTRRLSSALPRAKL